MTHRGNSSLRLTRTPPKCLGSPNTHDICIPRAILIVLDNDLINVLARDDYRVTTLNGKVLEWLESEIYKITLAKYSTSKDIQQKESSTSNLD